MKKRIILGLIGVVALVAGVAGMSAFEAHVINVTAHIENALGVDTYGIDFGTVFPQEYVEMPFTISLSDSFMEQNRADSVEYKIVQKDKAWTLNFDGVVDEHNRSLLCVDPDTDDLSARCVISGNVLTITTDSNDVEDLFGTGEEFGDVTAPRMVIPMGGNFTIETKVTANPQNYFQAGGILVYGSDGNVVRLELTTWTNGIGNNSIYMESQENQVKVGKRYTVNNIVGDTVYLKLTRTGNTFAGYYKENAGDSWQDIPVQEGKTDFDNEQVGNHPKVGLSAVNADPDIHDAFPAIFDYVTFNGDYLSLCRFLSKTKVIEEDGENDIGEPSYYVEGGELGTQDDHCDFPATQAIGYLSKSGDDSDTWNVDLKVPPVSGYVGQDWPESCLPWVVEEDEMDYGCDLWIEVTGIDRPF